MFLRLTKYGMLRTVREKSLLFWCLLFPLMLGTLFKVTFGDFAEIRLRFQQIPVAYVEENGEEEAFADLLKTLEQEEELITVVKAGKQEAENLLRDNKVKGIFLKNSEIQLIVTEEGLNQSILKSILEQYRRSSSTIENIAKSNPEGIVKAVEAFAETQSFIKESNITDNEMDYMVNYFYALLAMSCLYGSFMGLNAAIEFKADLSPLGMRRCVASSNRFLLLISDVVSKIIVQFLCSIVAMCYLIFVLKVEMGTQFLLMALILLAGSTIGVTLGVLVGALGKASRTVKEGISVSISMLLTFFAGLMIDKMYQMVEANAPLLNKINPAALIVNAFYSLNIYDSYGRYIQCIVSMFAIAGIMCFGVFLVIRRERYASL